MARGPDFITRKDPLPPFPNVDLYPLCCHLLQLTPAPNNGSLAKLQPYLGKISALINQNYQFVFLKPNLWIWHFLLQWVFYLQYLSLG